jgi:hypothetical protein
MSAHALRIDNKFIHIQLPFVSTDNSEEVDFVAVFFRSLNKRLAINSRNLTSLFPNVKPTEFSIKVAEIFIDFLFAKLSSAI